MGFSIEEKDYRLEVGKAVEYSGRDDMNLDILWGNLEHKINTLRDRLKNSKVPITLEIEVEEIDYYDTIYNLKYRVVRTTGPVIGFLGFYVDMESGYVVMSGRKKDEMIILFSLQTYLEGVVGGKIPLSEIKYFLEGFKIGNISIDGFFEKLVQSKSLKKYSFIANYFNEAERDSVSQVDTGISETVMFQFGVLRNEMAEITSLIQTSAKNLVGDAKNFKKESSVESMRQLSLRGPVVPDNVSEDLNEFFSDMFSYSKRTGFYNDELFSISNQVRYNNPNMQKQADAIHRDAVAKVLSSMPEPALIQWVQYKMPTSKFLISDGSAMNLMDLAEETEQSQVLEDYIDNIGLDREGYQEVLKKLGIDEMVSAYAYANTKKGMSKEAVKFAKRGEFRLGLDPDKTRTTGVEHYTFDYEKDVYINISKYIERINKKLDNI